MKILVTRWFVLPLLTSICFGCASSGAPTTAAPPARNSIRIENVTLDDQRAFNEARVPLYAGAMYFLDRKPKSQFLWQLNGGNYLVRIGVLRNPGAMLYIVQNCDGLPIAQKDRSRILTLANEAGVQPVENGRIPYRFGPDRQTPMIMPGILEYDPEKYAKIVPMSVQMTFKKRKNAKSAIDYVDSKYYVAKMSGSNLHISFKAPLGAATDEREAFDYLAKRFDGKVEWLQASE